ncbi:MAG TPA: hypothetical protein VKR55_02075 [Bradyrhizobium sp.]|uniref:hypothetical protein n=1 Tax=Bradyrhizobium sp. TaxID=376 RepID=UPI002BAA605E|nr:hypothetical protein [Bradyrhizobium sp.]HLZ00921.1 hypothetical protein [Bradyrhizobium sp.]
MVPIQDSRCHSRSTGSVVATFCARLMICAVALCAAGRIVSSTPAMAQSSATCVATISWTDPPPATPPADVCATTGVIDKKDFYALSWQLFKFLVWPASDQRGKPDADKKITDPGPRTFESLKADWETFLPDARQPADWKVYPDIAEPCTNHPAIGPGTLVLASFNKFGSLREVINPGLDNFLIAQNRTYVRYAVGYNQTVFDKIQKEGLYNRDNVSGIGDAPRGQPIPDPGRQNDGALTVKSAWVELPKGGPNHIDPSRFYFRDALIQDPGSTECRLATVGLVGLHIVYKTPSRPQWIWSTFEHVDNVREPDSSPGAHFTFNDGNPDHHMTAEPEPDFQIPRPAGANGPGVPPRAFQVERLQRIEAEVLMVNSTQQSALGSLGSVWKNYKLVMTQWPIFASSPTAGADASQPSCSIRNGSATVNTTMETFHQTSLSSCFVERTCMGCHEHARKTDYVFSILLQPNRPPNLPTMPASQDARAVAIKQLEDLLQKSKSTH